MDRLLSDWAAERSTCLTKALLDSLAGSDESGFDIYYAYLETCLLFDEEINFSALSRFGHTSKAIVSRYQYRTAHPSEEPAHFSFYSQHDVNRLASLRNLEIVVYSYDDRGCSTRIPAHLDRDYWKNHFENAFSDSELQLRRSRLTLFHDFRALQIAPDTGPRRVFYLVTAKNPRRLFRLPPDTCIDSHVRPWFADPEHPIVDASPRFGAGEWDYLAACDRVLAGSAVQDLPRTSDKLTSASDFLCVERVSLYDRWAQLQACTGSSPPDCYLVVTFCRLGGKSVLARRTAPPAPAQFKFTTLALASPRSATSEADDADFVTTDTLVLCLFADRYVCLLHERYRIAVVSSHLHAKGLKERLLNRTNFSEVRKKLTPAEVEEAKRQEKERVAKNLSRRRKGGCQKKAPKKADRAGDKIEKKCRCADCRSLIYTNNMARAGPERLCSSPYTARELLRLLGMLDAETNSLIERMLELSIAAMDLESQTIELSMAGPRPGPQIVYPEIAGPILEGHVRKVQQPIMIGHTDVLTRERGERWRDSVADDSVESIYKMFARYWLRVSRLQKEAKTLKQKTSEKLVEVIAEYRRAHFAFSDRWCAASRSERSTLHEAEQAELAELRIRDELDSTAFEALSRDATDRFFSSDEWKIPDAKAIALSFRHLPHGQLQRQLGRICNRYIVFSFYG